MSESAVVDSCIRWLFAQGAYVWRNNTGAFRPEDSKRFIRFGLPGSADILGLTPSGRFLAVECKYGKNKLSDLQEAFAERVKAKGGIFIVARSIDDLEARKAELLA